MTGGTAALLTISGVVKDESGNPIAGAVVNNYKGSAPNLVKYGATSFVGSMVGLTVTREIGPVIAGIMVAARCGSAMAAQIGTMAVTEQLDALKMLSVPPAKYLVLPRLIAGVTMLPVLCLVAMYAGIFGGWLVAKGQGIPSGVFVDSMQRAVQPGDFIGGMAKGPFFGLIIALVACQQGLRTRGGAVGVGRSTTNAVVISMVLVYIADYLLATVLY